MFFKLNFHISGESKLSNAAIFDRINSVLQYKKYRVLSTTIDTLTFDCNPWRLKWNFEPTQVSGGIFEIRSSADGHTVSLKYYNDFLYRVILFTYLFIVVITYKLYDGLWFFGVFLIISTTVDIIRVKNKGRELLRDVLTEGIN